MSSMFLIFSGIGVGALVMFAGCWLWFWYPRRKSPPFFLDPQDSFLKPEKGREYPESAKTATFEPFLKSYIEVMKLLVTVAAASIAFGAPGQHLCLPIAVAKELLALSVFSGVLFCAFLLYCYDEYGQNVNSYTAKWYALIFALGSSSLALFILGYLAWALGLSIC